MSPDGAFGKGASNETDVVRRFLAELEGRSDGAASHNSGGASPAQSSESYTMVPTAESRAVRLPNRAERLAARQGMAQEKPRRIYRDARDQLPPLEPLVFSAEEDEAIFSEARQALVENPVGLMDRARMMLQRSDRLRFALISVSAMFWPFGALMVGALWFAGWTLAFFSLGADRMWHTISQLLQYVG
ncbi:MAG: hypothetical protein AAF754_09310 [Pseudomonadota bacterium]